MDPTRLEGQSPIELDAVIVGCSASDNIQALLQLSSALPLDKVPSEFFSSRSSHAHRLARLQTRFAAASSQKIAS